MFGVKDSALRIPRNGLFLNKVVEKGLDNGWIAIVPDAGIVLSPTKWKIEVLNEDIRTNIVYTMPEPEGGAICWNVRSWCFCSYSCLVVDMYQNLDRRGLQFLDENRPARRYMYFRHAIAHLHAQMENLLT